MHRHQYSGRKLSRKAGARSLLLRNLATSTILYEKIKTTETKAKEVRPLVERLITLAKKDDLSSIRMIEKVILDKNAAAKLKKEIAPLYAERAGGYLRITKTGYRVGDGAQMVQLELLDVDKLDRKAVKEKPRKDKPAKTHPETKTSTKKVVAAKKKPRQQKKTEKK